jgi:thiamine biosynthesis lipoprotein
MAFWKARDLQWYKEARPPCPTFWDREAEPPLDEMKQYSRRRFLTLAAGAGGIASAGGWLAFARERRLAMVRREAHALGTKVSIAALHERPEAAEAAIDAALDAIDGVEDAMSLYRPSSQLCALNRDGALRDPHPDLVRVLRKARELSERSGGAFDVTVQPLWNSRDPERARRLVDWRALQVGDREIRFARPGMAATLNGIAQGFATDRALEALRARSVEHALVDAGELGGLGRREDGAPWTVGIQHPRRERAWIELARLDGRCMATSGDYRPERHLFDPRTGATPETFASVTVLAPTGLEADGLSTAVFVAGLERGAALVRATTGADAFFVLKDGRTLATPGFPRIDA